MNLWSLLPSLFAAIASCSFATAENCRQLYSVSDAILEARRLDGSVICVTGQVSASEVAGQGFLVVNLRPSENGGRGRIGLVSWDEAVSREHEYVPESFKKLERALEAAQTAEKSVVVTYRGIIMYRRDLLRTLKKQLPSKPSTPVYENLRKAISGRYDVEMVVLEVVSAAAGGAAR